VVLGDSVVLSYVIVLDPFYGDLRGELSFLFLRMDFELVKSSILFYLEFYVKKVALPGFKRFFMLPAVLATAIFLNYLPISL